MKRNSPGPNDLEGREERLKKTIDNYKEAEAAMEFADGKELANIKEANARRKENIEEMKSDIKAENKSKINGYI